MNSTVKTVVFWVVIGLSALLLWTVIQQGRGGPKDRDAAKAYYRRAADLGDEQAKAALKKFDCPMSIKDKRGNFITDLCF